MREIQYYKEAGLSDLKALQAGTIQPARMLGMEAQVGSLSVGKFADIVALDGNPAENISALRSLGFVMKGGRVYRNDWDKSQEPASPDVALLETGAGDFDVLF